jgi:hypothetical protein
MTNFVAYLEKQKTEALSDTNKYYCSKAYGYEVTDSEVLLRYYITNGGAKGYAERNRKKIEPP